jgi:prephenate dehydrogenase
MEHVAIVGLGLIGGSLGLALKRHVPGVEVIGIARREETAHLAIKVGAADAAGTDVGAVAEADLVVLACPLALTPTVLQTVAPHLAPGARVTDVGSVKDWVARCADKELDPWTNPFLGGHPMAGKEVTGLENADADLFRGRPWIFTPRKPDDAEPFADLADAVRAIGARPMMLTPQEHDRYVAIVSHLPFLLSAAYLRAVGQSPGWKDAAELASSGFRDISRLGAGDSEMYAAIAGTNREEMLEAWAILHEALAEFEAALARGDRDALLDLFVAARATRVGWAADHPGLA